MDGASSFDEAVQAALTAGAAGDGGGALAHLQRAARLQPGSALPHFLMAAEFAQAGQSRDAEAAYAQALLLAPGLDIARFQLGLLQFTDHRPAVALLTWAPLLTAAQPSALASFARAFQALAVDDLDSARSALVEGLSLPLDNPPLSADMHALVARIDAQRAGGGADSRATLPEPAVVSPAMPESANAAAPVDDAQSPSAQAMHVLLAGYRGSGSLH